MAGADRCRKDWIDSHEQLGGKILKRERALGMTPVLQGFTGHVPAAVAEKRILKPNSTRSTGSNGILTCSIRSTRCLRGFQRYLWKSRPNDSVRITCTQQTRSLK